MIKKIDIRLFVIAVVCFLFVYSCGKQKQNINETTSSEVIKQDEARIKYDSSLALSGWVALYDKNKQKRCYMSHDDYYSIKILGIKGGIKEEYSFLVPLGMVLKYSGANIIWGFDGVERVSWKDAQEYVGNYSPDGFQWRLLSKIEASAIRTNIYNFTRNFGTYYPNDLSYLGSFTSIHNWTSAQSDDVWIRNADGKAYKKVYTLDIYGDNCKINKGRTTFEEDLLNVYPISSL